jgi:hypothetical protein
MKINVSSTRYAHFQGSKGAPKHPQHLAKNSKKCEKSILKIWSCFDIDISLFFLNFGLPNWSKTEENFRTGDPWSDLFSDIFVPLIAWCILEAKWSRKSFQNATKLCISNAKMQQHLIAFAGDRFWFIRLSNAITQYAKHAKNAKNAKNTKNAQNAQNAKGLECFRDCPKQKGGGDPPPGGFQVN